LVSTILFALVPYWFVDLHIRGSIGEVWAIAWIMASLAAILRNRMVWLAFFVSLLCLSHNILAMLGIPILLFYVWFFRRKQVWAIGLGVMMAAYFWLPALVESGYMVGLNTVRFSDHFPTLLQLVKPSWGSVFSQPGAPDQEMSQQIGIVPLMVLILAIWMRIKYRLQFPRELLFWLVVFLLACLLMLPTSLFLWNMVTPLQLIQHPWRLLSLVLISLPFIAAWVVSHSRRLGVLLVILALVFSFRYLHPVEYQPRTDSQYLTNREFTDGTSSMGNSFSTIWTGWKKERPQSRVSIISGRATVSHLESSLNQDRFLLQVEDSSTILINRLYFPGWRVTANDRELPIEYQSDGILKINLPRGEYRIRSFFGDSPIRQVSNLISLAGFGTLVGVWLMNKLRSQKRYL
jgi:hypothetical protein